LPRLNYNKSTYQLICLFFDQPYYIICKRGSGIAGVTQQNDAGRRQMAGKDEPTEVFVFRQ